MDYLLLEASGRLGGRILSRGIDAAGEHRDGAYDLGPAWYWPAFQQRMPALVRELGLRPFAQDVQGALMWEEAAGHCTRFDQGAPSDGSMRVEGGLGALVRAMAARLDSARVQRGTTVTELHATDAGVRVTAVGAGGASRAFTAGTVITALPLRLLARSIRMRPQPPPAVRDAWIGVPTWMAGQAKVIAVYAEPFWRQHGLSGEARSRVGPLVEIHDASGPGCLPALTGFVGVPPDARRDAGDRVVGAAVQQLARLFGPPAGSPVGTLYVDWARDPLVATEDDIAPLMVHPSYGGHPTPAGAWAGRLLLAGTEAAPANGGYMEGALEASEIAVAAIT